MIKVTSKGNYKKTRKRLTALQNGSIFSDLEKYAQMGLSALERATPVDTGLAARSWDYRIIKDKDRPGIEWYNTDVEGGVNVIILIQYGHGTRNGGFVRGRDFINPAMRPVFDNIAKDIWKKVKTR